MRNKPGEVVTFYSGKKMRYRKDGKLDRRYTLGKTKVPMKAIKRRNRSIVIKHIKLIIVLGIILGLLITIAQIVRRETILISPTGIMPVAEAKEIETVTIPEEIDEVSKLFYKYDWPVETMIAIAKSENGYEYHKEWMPGIDFTGNFNGETDRGILMINSSTFADFKRRHNVEGAFEDMFDADKNVAMAFLVYKEQGLNAWTDYRNGRYLKFLEPENE